MRKKGYVLKVAVTSASILAAACGEAAHPVGVVAEPPRPDRQPDAGSAEPAATVVHEEQPPAAQPKPTAEPPTEVGTVAHSPDAGAKPPKPKVGIIARPPDAIRVGTTAHSPDSPPPKK